jgi:zinc protease
VREKEGLSYDVRTSLMVGPLDAAGQFGISAIYAPQNRERVERAVDEELQRALRDGFSAEELASAKHGLLEARRLSRTQDAVLASRWSYDLYLGRTFQWDEDLDAKINGVTAQNVQAALRKYIHPEALSVIRAGDFNGAGRNASGGAASQSIAR